MNFAQSRKNLLSMKLAALTVAAFAFGPALFTAGCTDSLPTDPSATAVTSFFELPYTDPSLALNSDPALASLNVQQLDDTLIAGEVFALDGGATQLEMGGSAYGFNVEPGAVNGDVTVTMTVELLSTKFNNLLLFEFGPDGLTFSNPALLTVNLASLNKPIGSTADFYWLDPATNRWVFQNAVKVDANGNAVFTINHFSMYGVE